MCDSMAFCSGAVVRLQVMTTRLIEQSCSAVSQEAKGLERSEFRSHIHLQGYIYIYIYASFLLPLSTIYGKKQLRGQSG